MTARPHPRPALHLNAATLMTTATARVLDIARRAGFDGIEARAERVLEDAAELRDAARAAREGEIWSLNGIRISLHANGVLDRHTLLEDLEPRLRACRELRAAYLLAVPPRLPGLSAAYAAPGIRHGLEVIRDRAAAGGVRVAFEFLGFPDCPVNTAARAADVVNDVPGVDLVLDTCHWYASGAAPLDAFPVERVAMIHVNDAPAKPAASLEDADRLLPGEGVIPLRDLTAALRERGYAGPFSVETFNPAHWNADPDAVAARAYASVAALTAERA